MAVTIGTTQPNAADAASLDARIDVLEAYGAPIPLTYLDTDGTLAANSAAKVAAQSAVVTYTAARIAAHAAESDPHTGYLRESALGTDVATFLGTPSSVNLKAAITDETGSGALVFATSPTLSGTPLAPTAAAGTNTTQIATTAFTNTAIVARQPVATKAALVALAANAVDAVFVLGRTSAGDGYQGYFQWLSGNQSAKVTADPDGGIWVAPTSDATGASGVWRRVYAGVADISWWGGVADNSTNNVSAWNAAMAAAAVTGGPKVIHFPAQGYAAPSYNFGSQPAVIPTGVAITCDGFQLVQLSRTYTPGATTDGFIRLDGINHYVGPFIIDAASGTTNGHAIDATASSSVGKGSFSKIDDPYVTGTGTWRRGLNFDGSAKVTGALGIRDIKINAGSIFQCTESTVALKGCKSYRLHGNLVSTPSNPSNANMLITGDATVTSDNGVVSLEQAAIVDIDYAVGLSLSVGNCVTSINIRSNSQSVFAQCGNDPATKTNSGTNCRIESNSGFNASTGYDISLNAKQVHTRRGGSEGDIIAEWLTEGENTGVIVYGVTSTGANAAATGILVQKNTGTSRSINAAGTINASGADYAEYHLKRSDCGEIAKGDLVGFDENGLLTDRFAKAKRFGVKSTSPNLVGGDVWGASLGEPPPKPERKAYASDVELAIALEDWAIRNAAFWDVHEIARKSVDRIAYCGCVPVNMDGGQAGDLLIPIARNDGGIAGAWVALDEANFEQFKRAIGVLHAVSDGQSILAVGVR